MNRDPENEVVYGAGVGGKEWREGLLSQWEQGNEHAKCCTIQIV